MSKEEKAAEMARKREERKQVRISPLDHLRRAQLPIYSADRTTKRAEERWIKIVTSLNSISKLCRVLWRTWI